MQRLIVIVSCLMLCLASRDALGFDPKQYKEAKLMESPKPRYPKKRESKAQAGVVKVEYVVNDEGGVESPVVLVSTHPEFEKVAMSNIKEYRFEPAELNGQKVKSYRHLTMSFLMRGEWDAVTRQFNRLYKRSRRELEKDVPDQTSIRQNLKIMNEQSELSMYGLAHKSFLEYMYATKFGSEDEQFDALEKLLLFEGYTGKKGKFLNESQKASILASMLALQLRRGRYGEASEIYETLVADHPNSTTHFTSHMEKLQAMLSGGQSYATELTLNQRGNYHILLTGQRFTLDQIEGEVSSFIFRCQAGAAQVDFKAESDFERPKNWGECHLQISGAPETKARLVQINSE